MRDLDAHLQMFVDGRSYFAVNPMTDARANVMLIVDEDDLHERRDDVDDFMRQRAAARKGEWMSQLNERGAHSERNSALWGTGGRGGDRSSVLWGKGGRGMLIATVVVAFAQLCVDQVLGEAEPQQDAHRVWGELQAGAEFGQLRRALEHPA